MGPKLDDVFDNLSGNIGRTITAKLLDADGYVTKAVTSELQAVSIALEKNSNEMIVTLHFPSGIPNITASKRLVKQGRLDWRY